MSPLTVLVPVPADYHATSFALARRKSGHNAVRVGLLGNSKANVEHLFSGIRSVLESDERFLALREVDKLTAQGPAPDEMLQELAQNCDVVVTAMAD